MSSKLAEIFGVEATEVEQPVVNVPAVINDESVEDIDFDAARKNQYELINQSRAAINSAMRVAAETDNARSFEVLGQLLKTASELNRQLITLSKDKAEAKNAKSGKGVGNQAPAQIGTVQNAVFVGNSSDLNKMITERMNSSV